MNTKYKQITREQYSKLINQAAGLSNITQPKEGWIKSVRSALAMSGAALSKRLGGHRSTVSYLERSELDGGITLKKMQETAEAMHCRFVYAIVPNDSIEKIIDRQAETIARGIVEESSVHMMLESQQLSKAENEKEIQRLKKQIIDDMPRDFWED
ncbi:MAG: mobile mystery protein A [Proteobacteria bacterium]|nr:mobile mystery protein A [Pseudomonadota bacterium]NOG60056.1 mobile mystery protein A [Pseudomonadota bacterium]